MSSNQVHNRMDLVRIAHGREPFDLIIQNVNIVNVYSEEIIKGNIGIGFICGFGIQRGAISSTVAHDHHNPIIAGVDDESMAACARAPEAIQVGLVAALRDTVLVELPLQWVV